MAKNHALKQKIVPCLWCDSAAEEMAHFYTSIFPKSKIIHTVKYAAETPSNKPVGSVMTAEFEILGYKLLSLNGGPYFKHNPSISFIVNFDPSKDAHARERLDEVWGKLSAGGVALMPLDNYPFSKHYGWIQDKYGVSWQLILTNPEGEERPMIMPSLMFVGDLCGKAEEASSLYLSLFEDTARGTIVRYGAGQEPDKEGTVMFTDFKLAGQWFAAMDSAHEHKFTFNEAISLMIMCADQKEIDYFYDKLSVVPEAEMCGWLKDKFGVSWQLVTHDMDTLMRKKEAMEALLKMKRIDIAALKRS